MKNSYINNDDNLNEHRKFIKNYFDYLIKIINSAPIADIEKVIKTLETAFCKDRTVFVIGNGGSASTASHMANDLGIVVMKNSGMKKKLRIVSLTDNVAALTTIGNDCGYEKIFVYQLELLFKPGDIVIIISASGNSINLIKAAEWIKKKNGILIGLLAFTGGALKEMCDIAVHFETKPGEFGPAEDAHAIINHLISAYFMKRFSDSQIN